MTSPQRERPAGPVADALRRAVSAGIITPAQADAVLAAEGAGNPATTRVRRRVPLTEALGYLGGVLALSGALTLAVELWDDVPTWGRLVVLTAVAGATWLVGARIDGDAAPALVRLRGALWFISSVAVAALAGQVASDVAGSGDTTALLSGGSAAAVHGGLLWRRRDRPAQHFACVVGVLVAVGAAAELIDGPGAVGLAIGVAGAAWVGAARTLPPSVLALVIGGVAVLLGAGITAGDWADAAPLLGLAAAAALVAVGVGTDRTPLTVVGLIGAFGYLPWAVGHFFAESLGVPLVMLLCGVALLAVTLIVLRRPARA